MELEEKWKESAEEKEEWGSAAILAESNNQKFWYDLSLALSLTVWKLNYWIMLSRRAVCVCVCVYKR